MTSAPAAFPAPARVLRPKRRPPPLPLWGAAFALFASLAAIVGAVFAVATPFPKISDTQFYNAQLANLDRQMRAFEARGQEPLSVVFIGTSRMKNVVFSADQVARAAATAGIKRPVANTYIAINWAGFERLMPAIELIERHRPDVVVLMPELFLEDVSNRARTQIGFHYLQSRIWGQDFTLFGDREYREPICRGFDETPQERLSEASLWSTPGNDLRGPRMARESAERLAALGIFVLIADVPVSSELEKYRPQLGGPDFFRRANLKRSDHIAATWVGHPFAKSDYCDWAHMDPARAGIWQRAFFKNTADGLNSLQTSAATMRTQRNSASAASHSPS